MADRIKILSWNVCFGCMYSNHLSGLDQTARTLATYCQNEHIQKGTNVCLNNVIAYINKNDYSIIGLQESSNYNLIYQGLLLRNPSLKYVNSKSGLEDIVTFYDSSKFTLLGAKCGEFAASRPILYLFLRDLNGNIFLVINLHNDHRVPLQRVENTINADLAQPLIGYTSMANIDNLKTNFHLFTQEDLGKYLPNANTIVLGDFNDHGNFNYWQGINIINSVVKSDNQPPKTCCTGRVSLRNGNSESLYGDYILIDRNKLRYTNDINGLKIENTIPPMGHSLFFANNKPTSDHLPVISYIKLKAAQLITIQEEDLLNNLKLQHGYHDLFLPLQYINNKNIGYDFDGVIHTDMKPAAPWETHHPLSYDLKTINKIYDLIRIKIKYEVENGANIFIITARGMNTCSFLNAFIQRHIGVNIKQSNIICTSGGSKINALKSNNIHIFHDDYKANIDLIKAMIKK